MLGDLNDSSQNNKKKKPQKLQYDNPFEAFEDLGKGIAHQAQEHVAKAKDDVAKQLFGDIFVAKAKDIKPGEEIDLKAHESAKKSMEKSANNIRPSIDYVGEILHHNEKQTAQDNQKLQQDIQNLIAEIKSLAGATKQLEKEVVEATGNNVVTPGKYHRNFFRFVISVIQDAKQKIDSAGTWLSAMRGKQKKGMGGKQKKSQNYWDMAEQHGAQFMLSGERAVSNQAG